jgi:ATPase, P-type (transporting), HAD superfamily, subfamily IC
MNNEEKTDKTLGLTLKQVNDRIILGMVNKDSTIPTKTTKQIILLNTFNLFNILNMFLAICVLLVGSPKNLLFLGGVICNTIISIFQELRTKKIIDKLSLIATTKANVIRDGKKLEISLENIVKDDVIIYKAGNQIPVDTIVLEGNCEVNESLLTGEDDLITKGMNDELLSGSYIVSGTVKGKVIHVGSDNYTSKITEEARYVKKVKSVLMDSLNKIIKWVSITVVPLGIILFIKQYVFLDSSIKSAVLNTVAAIIGMIPEGLVLLTSTVLAVAVIKLSKYKVLVQELYCIETLARTDMLCLDKTGTLTEGKMEVVDVVYFQEEERINKILATFSKFSTDENATMLAIKDKFKNDYFEIKEFIPFKSQVKCSRIIDEEKNNYTLGAPEFILDKDDKIFEEINEYSIDYRVLAIKKNEELLCILLLQDKIRENAGEVIAYFKKEGVDIKIISGDNPITVSKIAKRVGIDGYESYIDMTEVTNVKDVALNYSIFGRVTPEQKKELIIALKENGHTVAMTGDGVNDVLALKEADLSIAMNSGSDAARNVSKLVLMENNFDAMPEVLLEGRQTINNIERSASLFLTKTMYASMLAILFLFINHSYPFEPIQLTLTSVVAIGIPSFVLALEPNKNKVKGNFFTNVLSKSYPFAVTIVINIIFVMILSNVFKLGDVETSTLCVIMNAIISFLLLFRVSRPFNSVKIFLFISMIVLFIFQILGFRALFSLASFQMLLLFIVLLLTTISFMILNKLTLLALNKLNKKYK